MTYDEKYEAVITEALHDARGVQDFLWGADATKQPIYLARFDGRLWVELFQKRVDKIAEISPDNRHWKVELRKRLLQQAVLSLRAMIALENE